MIDITYISNLWKDRNHYRVGVRVHALLKSLTSESIHKWFIYCELFFFRYNVISIIESVSPYKQLRGGLEIVEEIPKLPSGKILRRKISTSGTV